MRYEPGIIQSTSLLPGALPGTSWAIEEAARLITHDSYQKTAGCMLCQGIDLPGININAIPEGNINYNAFLRSYVGQGRVDFPQMRMTFIDTNISFADNFLRPWALATATFGMIARERSSPENYRTDLQCWQLGAYDATKPPTILKQITFYDICCVAVNNEELNYLMPSGPQMREAQFIYNYYTIKSSKEINEFITMSAGGIVPPATDEGF